MTPGKRYQCIKAPVAPLCEPVTLAVGLHGCWIQCRFLLEVANPGGSLLVTEAVLAEEPEDRSGTSANLANLEVSRATLRGGKRFSQLVIGNLENLINRCLSQFGQHATACDNRASDLRHLLQHHTGSAGIATELDMNVLATSVSRPRLRARDTSPVADCHALADSPLAHRL